MAPRSRRQGARPPGPARSVEPEGPSLIELERFSRASLQRWRAAANQLGRLQTALYFGLEASRQDHRQALLDALRAGSQAGLEIRGWSRIVDYRHSLAPLSVAGSLKAEGGRFNIGGRLSPGTFTPFPALYLGEDYATAYQERFGPPFRSQGSGLTGAEFALRKPGSFTQVQVHGQIDLVLDVGNVTALKPFVDVIRKFGLPAAVRPLARQLSLRHPPGLVRSASALRRQLLNPNWRILPMHYDLPANSQVFGRIAAAAGLQGILYPSVRASGKRCLALFPQNWANSGSYIEVSDPVPPEARLVRLDASTGAVE